MTKADSGWALRTVAFSRGTLVAEVLPSALKQLDWAWQPHFVAHIRSLSLSAAFELHIEVV